MERMTTAQAVVESLVQHGLLARAPLLPGFGAGMLQLAGVSADDWLAAASHAWVDITARLWSSVQELVVTFGCSMDKDATNP